MSENWKESVTNSNWKNEIVCPYCGHKYLKIHSLDATIGSYMIECEHCKERESWLEEYNLYTTYEEGLGIYD